MKAATITRALAAGASLLAVVGAVALSALLWFIVLGAAGIGLVVAGVYVLAGLGWALIAAGVFLLLVTALVGRGMNHA
ncbi:hypothetical protein [Variovorax paradoxus]|uniref:Uncharacterized protein n=1 Tax=Variovorax paradoxus TaxID=34073 RepID=A0A679JBF0_VARPD|nr:hypothetical protein VVAX_03543 [Variovorax paradoxus]